MAKETAQRLGLEGLTEIKEWLEATIRYNFTYTSWDRESMCTVTCLNGDKKTLDLEGHTMRPPPEANRPVSVECKNYNTPGAQHQEYRRFLAIAYSSTAQCLRENSTDWEREFMWVTFHPFAQTKWRKLTKVSYMKACVEEFPELLDGQAIDDDLLSTVASRTSLMVVGRTQVGLRLTKPELRVVHLAFEEKGWMS